jgi:polyhydroxybutyrate depolymerase
MAQQFNICFFAALFISLSCGVDDKSTSDGPRPNEVNVIEYNGRSRTYLLHVPPSYSNSQPAPLVIMLHGYTGTSTGHEQYTGFSVSADAEGYIVIYADGLKYPWNASNPQAWNAGAIYEQWTGGTDDVGFLRRIVEEVCANYNIDDHRIYATGHSNGAFMCYRLAYEMSDVIAAIAPVSGQMLISPDRGPDHKISILHLHATNDPDVLYNGRKDTPLSYNAVDTVLQQWAKWYGCTEEADTLEKNLNYLIKSWPCEGGVSIKSYVLSSGGHSWFTFENSGLKANDVILEFFNNHTRYTK